MALINSQTPPTLTLAQKQAKLKANVANGVTQIYKFNLTAFTQIMNLIWHNADGLTPQQSFDAVGTDSASLLNMGAELAATINLAVPNSVATGTPVPLTVNPDGTVTVTVSA